MALAHFSKFKALMYVAAMFALISCVLASTLYHPDNVSLKAYIESKGPHRFEIALVVWAAALLLSIRLLVILGQVAFRNGRAVWVRNDKLYFINIYLSFFPSFISREATLSITISEMGGLRSRAIIIETRNGSEVKIATWILSASADTVLIRLRQWASS